MEQAGQAYQRPYAEIALFKYVCVELALPMLLLLPQADRKVPETGIYNCPVYKVVSRKGTLSTTGHSTNFVRFMEMPTDESEEVWIRAGVAAFLALRY